MTLFVLAVGGIGWGCVDTTPPWEKAGWAYRDSGASPTPDDVEPAAAPDAEVSNPETDLPVPPEPSLDAGEDQRSGRADAIDAQADTRPSDLASPVDVHDQPQDVGPDSPNAGEDVSPPRDQGLAFEAMERDARSAELLPDVTTPVAEAGPEALPTQNLVAYYSCESANGSVLADQSGNKEDATLANGSGGTTPVGFTFVPGEVGKAMSLSAQDKAFVHLPAGIASSLTQMTVATWVKLNANTAFQRIFDFGVDTNTFMYLSNSNGSGGVRFRIASVALNKNQVVEGPTAMSVGTWTHITVTLGDDGVSLFVDGSRVAQQAPAAIRPADLGDTGNNYIGRSQFASDPYLDGQVDEFRIYSRVLSASEIKDLASGL